MNQIVLTGTLADATEGCMEFLLLLPGVTIPMTCQLEGGVWENQLPLGSRICVKGKLASRDLSKINPCECQTLTNIIECYIKVAEIEETTAISTYNDVVVSGRITNEPKLVTVAHANFYSTRIRMDDGMGFVTITTLNASGVYGNHVTVHGRLQAKDYRRHLECPCCGKHGAYPILSVVVRETAHH